VVLYYCSIQSLLVLAKYIFCFLTIFGQYRRFLLKNPNSLLVCLFVCLFVCVFSTLDICGWSIYDLLEFVALGMHYFELVVNNIGFSDNIIFRLCRFVVLSYLFL
jgi:hypothetical protein